MFNCKALFLFLCIPFTFSGCVVHKQRLEAEVQDKTIGHFFEDHVAILKHLPCQEVGEYQIFDTNPGHFTCVSGQWGEVSLRLNHNGSGKTKNMKLFWRVYPDESFFYETASTVLPFFDFITQRYGQGAKTTLRNFLEENTPNRMKLNGLNFKHEIIPVRDMNQLFDQHSLIIYRK